jgi:hypothetical protein
MKATIMRHRRKERKERKGGRPGGREKEDMNTLKSLLNVVEEKRKEREKDILA